jgi:hypothetical protein
MRTFVISDAHGYPELIQNALDHGGFRPDEDGFVYAGDLFDRGPDPGGCIDLVEDHATEVLMGNHDVAVLLDYVVYPQEPENRGFRPLLIDKVLNAGPSAAWKAATCIDGVLITHAGVSEAYEWVFQEECQSDPEHLAKHLNQAFLIALRGEFETGEYDEQGILGDDGPTWFRPRPYTRLLPLAGIRQVVGHTPPVPELESCDFHMVDPCAFLGMENLGRFRYAVIEDGWVRVEEGTLLGSSEFSRREDFIPALCR